MKALVLTNVIAFGLLFVINGGGSALVSPPETTNTHRGTSKLFGEAVLNRDVEAMKMLCIPSVQHVPEMIMNHQNLKNVTLERFDLDIGGAAKTRTSVRVLIYANRQHRLTINMSLEEQPDGQWIIYELAEEDPMHGGI